ncbi:MAG: GntR family transcriptional regulator [Frondihabitans sp.]|nr:GntR family transcriptional regulator [Frondihabitans sp.]
MTTDSQNTRPKRPQLSDDAARYVRNLIMAGEILPGASVRPEAIGEALDISATPAREALQVLRVEGFLDLLPRRGFIVAPLTGADIRDLFRANALISGELAARAATVATSEQIAELQALHYELLAAAGRRDLEALEEKNFLFHRQINRIAESRKLAWVLGIIDRYVPRLFYSEIEGWPSATSEGHLNILESIKAGDAERARETMTLHVTHSGDLLADQFDKRTIERSA